MAFGRFLDAQYRLDRAEVIVSLDSDFLASGSGSLRYARDFASRRRPEQADRMSRLYALEGMPTPTGARADHRLPLRPGQIEQAARRVAMLVGVAVGASPRSSADVRGQPDEELAPAAQRFIDAVATDLRAHRGRSLVIAGDHQPPAVHALAHAINQTLGNTGETVVYTRPVEAEPVNQLESLRELTSDMRAGRVDLLVILAGNPVYTAPVDLGFADAMNRVTHRVHLSLYDDETSALCHWQIPETHFLEAWSDARGHDGTASIIQPLIAPLYAGKSAHEVIAAFSDRPERSGYEIVREFWKVDPRTDANWRRWLHDGVIPDSAFEAQPVTLSGGLSDALATGGPKRPEAGLELSFRLDPSILDGRFGNNGWLQELPKPVTKLTWDNAILMSPATAARLGLRNSPSYTGGEHGQIISDVVELRYRERSVRGAVFTVVGHPDEAATLHLGYGRTRAGGVAEGAGFNANAVRTSDALWVGYGVEVVKTGGTTALACTQYHHLMEGRGLVRAVARDEYVRDPKSMHEGPGLENAPPKTITLYPDYRYEGYKWGMAIDLNQCIGCNACVVGCQAENNIPVIGKDQVLRGREMHWIRIDTYYRGPAANPETYFQPVPCMQCENAPCEVVCPVGATVHSHEGLNDMVYNRCVGTRYCSNSCPYKVRRFNYLLYQDWDTPSLKLGRNPDVTVRSRGVMEKCTYCVQRINAAKIESEKLGRRVRDGEIKTACQQACPAEAIIFGDLNDPTSRVARLQAEVRNYPLLGELNTRPRTTYLGAVRNVNPELGR
jgi:molybdopterin-containing oxidoreductase family iron-sulfur binding subunit